MLLAAGDVDNLLVAEAPNLGGLVAILNNIEEKSQLL